LKSILQPKPSRRPSFFSPIFSSEADPTHGSLSSYCDPPGPASTLASSSPCRCRHHLSISTGCRRRAVRPTTSHEHWIDTPSHPLMEPMPLYFHSLLSLPLQKQPKPTRRHPPVFPTNCSPPRHHGPIKGAEIPHVTRLSSPHL
jgi:hypothetical protein